MMLSFDTNAILSRYLSGNTGRSDFNPSFNDPAIIARSMEFPSPDLLFGGKRLSGKHNSKSHTLSASVTETLLGFQEISMSTAMPKASSLGIDLRSSSPSEMSDFSLQMYEQKIFSLRTHAVLSFDPWNNPDSFWTKGPENMFMTPETSPGKYDWVEELTQRVEDAKKRARPYDMVQEALNSLIKML